MDLKKITIFFKNRVLSKKKKKKKFEGRLEQPESTPNIRGWVYRAQGKLGNFV